MKIKKKINKIEVEIIILAPLILSILGILYNIRIEIVSIMYIFSFIFLGIFEIKCKCKREYGKLEYTSILKYKFKKTYIFYSLICLVINYFLIYFINKLSINILLGILIYSLFAIIILKLYVLEKMSLKIYNKGLLVKGKFYSWNNFSDIMLLKTYKDDYELKIINKKLKHSIVSLNKIEIEIILEYIN